MKSKIKKQKLIYFVEERVSSNITRYYCWYLHASAPVQTLFDIKPTREEAEQAIELHKQDKHDTQWTPDKTGE